MKQQLAKFDFGRRDGEFGIETSVRESGLWEVVDVLRDAQRSDVADHRFEIVAHFLGAGLEISCTQGDGTDAAPHEHEMYVG